MLVKQNPVTIRLRDSMDCEDGWGHSQGRRVHDLLLRHVETYPEVTVFRISLDGVRRTDASFPRESVVELARQSRGQRGFCLVDVSDADLLDNWDSAAVKREQPLLVWKGRKHRLLGPPPTEGLRPLFELSAGGAGITVAEAAHQLGLNVPNTSNKLRTLWEGGYLLRHEQVASTGGVEFEYYAAR
jgi:hypothetical protein